MLILALDTAMATCSVAVIDSDRNEPLAARCQAMERGHAEALAPMVERVVAEAGVSFSALDRIAVTTGPGTFTGVRIGLAMARGLGLALARPVIGIDSLTVIAANAGRGVPVLVTADARNGEVYFASFGAAGGRLAGPAIMTVDEAVAQAVAGTTVLGSAADAVVKAAPGLMRGTAGDLPHACHLARLAAVIAEPDAMPSPLYLRAPDAKPQVPLPVIAETRDAALLSTLHAACFDEAWTREDFARLLAMSGTTALIASNSEAQGFALFRRAADEVEVITIGTAPPARRRGLARALLEHHFTRCRAEGVAAAFIEVASSNLAAQALYAGLGFVPAGLRKNYYGYSDGHREDAVVMRKDLLP